MESNTTFRLKSGVEVQLTATKWIGKISNVLFSKGSFYIVKVNEVVCKGNLPELNMAGVYELDGRFVYDKKFSSWNFEFGACRFTIDQFAGLKELLTREAPFVGPATAISLVEQFGNELLCVAAGEGFEVLGKHCKGLSVSKLAQLHSWAMLEVSTGNLKIKLYGIGLKPGEVKRLINHFGLNAEAKIKQDVFKLIDIDGFGFKTTSRVADMLGVKGNDAGRIKCAIMCVVEEMQQHGHCFVAGSELIREVCGMCGCGVNAEGVCEQIKFLVETRKLIFSDEDFSQFIEQEGIEL